MSVYISLEISPFCGVCVCVLFFLLSEPTEGKKVKKRRMKREVKKKKKTCVTDLFFRLLCMYYLKWKKNIFGIIVYSLYIYFFYFRYSILFLSRLALHRHRRYNRWTSDCDGCLPAPFKRVYFDMKRTVQNGVGQKENKREIYLFVCVCVCVSSIVDNNNKRRRLLWFSYVEK